MLSYRNIIEIDRDEVANSLALSEEEGAYLEEILDSFISLANEGVSVAVTIAHGSLSVRIIDGESCLFFFPIAFSVSADISRACLDIAEYARKELVPLTFTDVPRECIGELSGLFSRLDARAYEDDEDCFFVMVCSECSSLDNFPTCTVGDIILDEIAEEDKEVYASLCRDKELNKWWGYDVSEDNPEGESDYYLAVARGEYKAGVAITLAIRNKGSFVGEAVIYDFDYQGGAAIGIRILPEHQQKGIGSKSLEALISLCKKIGLVELRASIVEENKASVAMTKKYMSEVGRQDGVVAFALKI